ncbi:MAG: S-layer homology domain-containing protein [Clostridia bacterium]|nr:S-layer homology domain-containing protein [Clostridia bacterium]
MKKTLALLLTLIMLFTAVPMSVSADEDYYAYGAIGLDNAIFMGATGMSTTIEEENGISYLHYVVSPGTYTNNNLQIAFAPNTFSIADYAYIKVGYRTDCTKDNINTSSRSLVGESWYSSGHPKQTGDGKWHDVIFDTNKLTGGKGLLKKGDNTATLVLKPYGSQTVTIAKESYFDIQYVACFKTEAEAIAYKYTPESETKVEVKAVENALAKADDELLAKYMAEADALIEEIINMPTTVEVTGTKYYVSANGSDDNDGLTPETAWRTVEKVNAVKYNAGDGVFFRRGDEWRIVTPLYVKDGVTYSAYGEGAKPRIIASVDGMGEDKWALTKYENIYMFNERIPDSRDVGTIVFDGGDAWGIQIQQTTEGNWLEIGRVYNGLEWYDTPTGAFAGYQDLCYDLQFYHDWGSDTLYLYSKDGNPGERFSSIEIVDKGHGISGAGEAQNDAAGSADIVIDNFEIYGAGAHGVGSLGYVKNVTVQNCVFKWIGGSIQGKGLFDRNYGVRYGNAVESYGSSENFTIAYCYATQVYDCCWTVQQQEAATFINTSMHHNVAEFCNTGLEVWQEGGTISGMDLHDNYTRFNGYGWSHQRPNKDPNFFYGGSGGLTTTYENNSVHNNVNMLSQKYAFKVRATGSEQYNFHDNIYIMEEGTYLGGLAAYPGTGAGGFSDIMYTEKDIGRALGTGFEAGGKFYVTEPEPYGDMFDLYVPEKVGIDLFADIPENFWGRDAISFVYRNGYFNGVSETEFSPNGSMTRAMLVTVLSRMAGEGANAADATYTDINKSAWYAAGVAWAEKAGIVNAGGTFRPDENATREELADMLYRFASYSYRKTDLTGASDFKDSATVNAAYADGIKFCTSNGIIGGYEDGTIKPKNSATRAEVATMMMRFANYLENTEYDNAKIEANSKKVVVTGDALKKILDNKDVRATVQEDKTVKFTPFKENGSAYIGILNSLNKDISFLEYPYIAIKFDTNLGGSIIAKLFESSTLNAALKETNIQSLEAAQASGMIFDMTEYTSTVDKSSYEYNLVLRIYPWGQASTAMSADEYFTIEEIVFFDNLIAAESYLAD